MSSGDPVVIVLEVMPPATLFASFGFRAGGSTPNETIHTWLFDDATNEFMDLKCMLVGYDGGGLTFVLPWSAVSAIINETRWGVAIRRVADDAEDIDASHSYDFNDVDDTAPNVSGELSYPTVAFTDGVDMDSWSDGEIGIVRIRRNAIDANDDMVGDAELWAAVGKET